MLKTISCLCAFVCLSVASWTQSTARPNSKRHGEITDNGSTATVVANCPDPLLQAIEALRDKYGWRINWEEAPFYSRFDIVDSTDPEWRAEHPNAKGATRVAGGFFTSAIPSGVGAPVLDAPKAVLEKLVEDYNKSDNPGKYIVIESDNGPVIQGVKVRDENGALQDVRPVLDTIIDLPKEPRSTRDTVEAILTALSSAAGAKVVLMGMGGFSTKVEYVPTQIVLGGHSLPARQLLIQALASEGNPRYYRLGFEPDPPTYYLNIDVVRKTDPKTGLSVPIDRLQQ